MIDVHRLFEATSKEEQRELLGQIVDLLAGVGSEAMSEDDIVLLANVIVGILDRLDVETRLELSIRMATLEKAPASLIHELAISHIRVARPVLCHSPRLDDTALAEIARTKGGEHSVAIAQRRSVSREVSEAILAKPNADAALTLVRNPGAELSERAFQLLGRLAEAHIPLEEALCSRNDLPPALDRKIMKSVRTRLQSDLGSKADALQLGQIKTIMGTADIQKSSEGTDMVELSLSATIDGVKLRYKKNLTEEKLQEFMRDGKRSHAVSVFAQMAKLEPAIARRLLMNPLARSLALACRATPVSRETYRALVEGFAAYIGQSAAEALGPLEEFFESMSIREARDLMEVHRRLRAQRSTRRSDNLAPDNTLLVTQPIPAEPAY